MIPDEKTLLEKLQKKHAHSRWLALLFSALIPGAGQIYNGEFLKGALILAVTMGGMVFLGDGLKDVFELLISDQGRQALLSGEASMVSPDVLSAAVVLQVVVLFSLWDAYRGARPTPPGM